MVGRKASTPLRSSCWRTTCSWRDRVQMAYQSAGGPAFPVVGPDWVMRRARLGLGARGHRCRAGVSQTGGRRELVGQPLEIGRQVLSLERTHEPPVGARRGVGVLGGQFLERLALERTPAQ